jgi:hypothetical protein
MSKGSEPTRSIWWLYVLLLLSLPLIAFVLLAIASGH